ncbi:Alpha/beta hydrolase [Methylocella tundrae]|uniref:Alpha/beta hydrolase n=2 Tax=Methylocella tundrae TaxID=227605 RepID=A0A8B6M979_METTU|nr:Alpha/beta hydrolase [Methylocella tundrae]
MNMRQSSPCSDADASGRKPVKLALQGGGAHGAFVWGMLDRLLEDGRLRVEAISATSSGAMNAVALAYGLAIGGPEAAREKLAEFWRGVSRTGQLFSPVGATPLDAWLRMCGAPVELTPSFIAFQTMTQTLTPQQCNPLDLNPLKTILLNTVDFDRLKASPAAPPLFISATNVRTGKIKVFEKSSLSLEAVLASACLPQLFRAVEIDGEHYWDGGYMGNPAIFPLIYAGGCKDVLIVHVNPIERPDLPVTATAIANRVNEISFNSSLMREMRAIAFVTQLLDENQLDSTKYSRMFIHWLGNDAAMAALGAATKIETDWNFLRGLFEEGRRTATKWLDANVDAIGSRSTVDLATTFM